MRAKVFLVAAMLTAIPGELPVRATSAPPPLAEARVAPPETFAPICRSGEIDAGRPQPAWLRQSFIGDACEAPPLPAAIDGYTASREEIVAGMEAVKKYQVAAKAFEACVGKFIAVQAQNKDRPMSRSEAAIQNYRIIVSQRARTAAKLRMESSIIAFNEYGSTCPE